MMKDTKAIKCYVHILLIFCAVLVTTAFPASRHLKSVSPFLQNGGNNNNKLRSHRQNDERLGQIPLEAITLQPIGHVSSVYRLCVGTPRQGLLAPNSRGRIDLYPTRISSDSVIDLDKFSHLWIVFIFHLNSNTRAMERSKQKEENGEIIKRQFPSKIAPPALGGERVGIFATRSPHRPNPVGFTLCKIDKIVIPKKKKHQTREEPYHIYISGIDLVDGTPVLDIKPYVPYYDSVGFINEGLHEINDATDIVKVPDWVSDGLGKRRPVHFSKRSINQLYHIIKEDKDQLEFYGVHSGRDESDEQAFTSIQKCIMEVLSVDVRSRFQTKKVRKGKFKAELTDRVQNLANNNVIVDSNNTMTDIGSKSDKVCTQQIDRLLIKYTVIEARGNDSTSAVDTDGSGADDEVEIQEITLLRK